ncbi:MAG: DNA polymerase III subunit alpha [Bacteroidales bacterium]|nr:DNA polymerase III subunit alpha [Bacteroidales bacterium]
MFLNCHTYYSLRHGTISPTQLAKLAFENDSDSIILTDVNNTSGIPEFYLACRKSGIKPIAGVDIRDNSHKQLFVLIARNNHGLAEINKYLSEINQGKQKQEELPEFNNVYIIIPFENFVANQVKENEFIGVKPSDVKKLLSSRLTKFQSKMVILYSVSFRTIKDYELFMNLRAINNNSLISKLPAVLHASSTDIFIHPSYVRKIYSDYTDIITNTLNLLKTCSLSFNKEHKNKKTFTDSFNNDVQLLRKLSERGLKNRYGFHNPIAYKRMQSELQIIEKLKFVSYFLIAYDIVRYAQSRNFFYVGRGSGANSIVAYCLQITDVDPIELNLYFERFLNPKRSTPPDFDIDFSWRDRDNIFKYIFKKYGSEHTALLGAMSTFKTKSILRELGKVNGLPKPELDILAKNSQSVKDKDSIHRKIIEQASELSGFPNLRTIHSGGVLISDFPIYYFAALDMPQKGFPTTQWDMYVAEDLGFEKFDILSQRGLGHIRDCVEIVSRNQSTDIDIHKVDTFKKDPKINEYLSTGNTIGCFYIESPAMRGLISKLKCQDYITLVAASSIIRPGVSKSGMMKEYIVRYNNPGSFEYLHPIMEKQLCETYGVMVYQEDVLKVCHHYAGMDLADADVLRRAMSGKFRSRTQFDNIRDKFFAMCNKLNRPENVSTELWRQIESFAGYSFSKAHSASYAVESYQSLYLKTYYPLEFMTAVINNFGGFYESWVYFHEAKTLGANIKLPCINNSEYLTRIINKDIYIGFIHVQSLEHSAINEIVYERNLNGSFKNFNDFINRCSVSEELLNTLIRIGALNFTGFSKTEIMWKSCMRKAKTKQSIYESQKRLFTANEPEYKLPTLKLSPTENAYDEIELLGFPVSISFFDLLQTNYRGEVKFNDMLKHCGKTVRMLGVFVCLKYVRTSNGQIMNFMTWIDAEGNFYDSVHFPDSLKEYPFKGAGVYLMLGIIDVEFGYPLLRTQKLAKMPFKPDPRE